MLAFTFSLKRTGKHEIEEIGLGHEESQYSQESLISRYQIHACVAWAVVEKAKSYETLFTYLFSHLVYLLYGNRGKLMLRICIWTRPY